jgi:WD40 repeat protein
MPMPATWFDYTVSKSGRLLSYSTAEERPAGSNVPAPGETRLRNLVTGDDRLLVKYDNSRDGNHLTVEFSWDDKSLIYAIPTGEWRVMDLETLKSTEVPKVQGLDVPLDGTEPSWSPDGKFVILGGRMPREALRFFEMTAESVARAATAGVKK